MAGAGTPKAVVRTPPPVLKGLAAVSRPERVSRPGDAHPTAAERTVPVLGRTRVVPPAARPVAAPRVPPGPAAQPVVRPNEARATPAVSAAGRVVPRPALLERPVVRTPAAVPGAAVGARKAVEPAAAAVGGRELRGESRVPLLESRRVRTPGGLEMPARRTAAEPSSVSVGGIGRRPVEGVPPPLVRERVPVGTPGVDGVGRRVGVQPAAVRVPGDRAVPGVVGVPGVDQRTPAGVPGAGVGPRGFVPRPPDVRRSVLTVSEV